MSHIAVDLKVLEVFVPAVARATGIHEDRILSGLVRVWHRCWSVARASLSVAELSGAFGPENLPALVDALGVDFLELQVDGTYRVRGADRYLRIKEARRRGAEATNRARAERRMSDAQATQKDALTPSTEHRAPNTIEETHVEPRSTPVDLEAKLTLEELQVWRHWQEVLKHPHSKPTSERKRLIAKWLKVYSVLDLQLAVEGCSRTPWNMGENPDRKRYDSLELILRDAKHIEDFMGVARVA